ncbi:MAG: tRNA uridine-5-carboxymethylaminomethyl(34) synthesis GTPase MnmE [Alphaproteobacteria bacterium]|nr:tRNA uridine-5-carboxymethylaminomethyl(34) synthesis GTPase MnmE [Alphaproteobacteria bacterium]
MIPSYNSADTIYALSSGTGRGGVAVIRVSGTKVLDVIKHLSGLENPKARYAYFRPLSNASGQALDNALVLYFKGPYSFTGEDVVEFQVHGGRSVISAVMQAIADVKGCRPAEPGEYSRRAVVNGKMDLTEAEGLMDLINAETGLQRAQAYSQMNGVLGKKYEGWRRDLKHHMAYLEAFIDFPEEDIPPEKLERIDMDVKELAEKIALHLDDDKKGQKLRDGFQIAIVGRPNAGKSSLINALTQKDVAIVSQTAGTTRDVVEAHLDVAGFPVILADTAGLREGAEEIETEGIRRAVKRAEEADLILHVQDGARYPVAEKLPTSLSDKKVITIWNKVDEMTEMPAGILCLSAKTGQGVDALWQLIKNELTDNISTADGVITRERYRVALTECVEALNRSLYAPELELKAEDLRMAARALGRITGRIDTEELLDVIFRDFCIGK